jgi:2-oxoglutarate dehydrogenase E1 component
MFSRSRFEYLSLKSCIRHLSKETKTTTKKQLPPEELQLLYRRCLRGISAFRNRGHFAANLDPLQRQDKFLRGAKFNEDDAEPEIVQFLKTYDGRNYDFNALPKMGQSFNVTPYLDDEILPLKNDLYLTRNDEDPNGLWSGKRLWSVNALVHALVGTYSSNVGVEFSHLESDAEKTWLLKKVEAQMGPDCSTWNYNTSASMSLQSSSHSNPRSRNQRIQQMRNLNSLIRTHMATNFLNTKYPSSKVFGIEGCEALIPAMWAIIGRGAHKWGLEGVELGMAHRGRLNVLHDVLGKSFKDICSDFNEKEHYYGDVKYHLGTRSTLSVESLDNQHVKQVHVSLAANPSHLEAVNAVVIGKCRAKQKFMNDEKKVRIMPLLLHGDASFSGQGIVSEVLELSNMTDYSVGGTIHIIVNNQIGFTTTPNNGRTAFHCTDVAKGVGAPIFHVNADDVDAVVRVCKLATDWRNVFHKDVVIDLVCYRRHGHNELEDPKITHPVLYNKIASHPPVLSIYAKKLVGQGLITMDEVDALKAAIVAEFEADYQEAKGYNPNPMLWLQRNWQGDAIGSLISRRPFNTTGVRPSTLQKLGKALTFVPEDFVLHSDIKKLIAKRKRVFETGRGVTWALAEALAFGSLVTKFHPSDQEGIFKLDNSAADADGAQAIAKLDEWSDALSTMRDHPCVHVRLSGQDCIRGTFNQRHAAYYCQSTSKSYWPLNNLEVANIHEYAQISLNNSNLSEYAALGFEYGYSLSNEMTLTIWEAQFGDFFNNAQALFDTFIASGEEKWGNKSSLVLLLPHGYDGNGPDHSSARLERFLLQVDDDADAIAGRSDCTLAEIDAGFDKVDVSNRGHISAAELRSLVVAFISKFSKDSVELDEKVVRSKLLELMNELGVEKGQVVTRAMWRHTMRSWLHSRAEQRHNIIVAVPSTPAQYFHVLRRQIHRPFAKPLVCLSAKWMLHHANCVSDLESLTLGTHFQRIITEGAHSKGDNTSWRMKNKLVPNAQVKRLVLCSGQIFYQLFNMREAHGIQDVAFIRLEQIAPFPHDVLGPAISLYPNARVIWAQEEPKNQGAYYFVKPRLMTTMDYAEKEGGPRARQVEYVGRAPSAASASGAMKLHHLDQNDILRRALGIDQS